MLQGTQVIRADNAMLSAALKLNKSLIPQCQRKLVCQLFLFQCIDQYIEDQEVPSLGKGYMLQLALLRGDQSCFLSIFCAQESNALTFV